MTNPSKQSRTKDSTKKIVSLTLDPVLLTKIDAYAADKGISRSAAVELSIMELLPNPSIAVAENSALLPEEGIFATPSLGTAIFY